MFVIKKDVQAETMSYVFASWDHIQIESKLFCSDIKL